MADRAAGVSKKTMAERYGVSISTLTKFLTKHSIARTRRVAYPADGEIVGAMRAGKTITEMAAKFAVNRDSLRLRIVDRRLRDLVDDVPEPAPIPSGPQASPTKHIVTAPDGSRISVPRIPTLHGTYEARP